MNALSHAFDLSEATELPPLVRGFEAERESGALALRWDALHDAADTVATLARLSRRDLPQDAATLPRRAAIANPERRAMVIQGVDDLSAVMQTGLTALLRVVESGGQSHAAATTLLREFENGREAICTLVEPPEAMG